MKKFWEEVRRMVRINSVTQTGDEELANFCATLLQDRGLKAQVQHVMHSFEGISKRQFNVIGILGDPLVDRKTRKGLLLSTHLDTASPGLPENWTETSGDPFAAVVKDGKVFGLGAADAKIDFLCKLRAIDKYREKKLKMPVYVVGTCGQELGMFGVKYLIKSLTLNPKYVVVGEPTELKLVHSHKSMTAFRISIGYQLVERDARGFNRRIDLYSFGRGAHGAAPQHGINAILQATDFLQQAIENGFELRFTRLDGGDTINKVPDRAMAEFYLTSHQFEDFKRFFRETVRRHGKDRTFRVELGGLGDMGVRFLPDPLFPCLSELLRVIREMNGSFEKRRDEGFDPPHSTINLGQLRQRLGGMDLGFDLRTLPAEKPEEIEAQLQSSIQQVASRYPNLNITLTRERSNPSLQMSKDHELVRLCREAQEGAKIPVEIGQQPSSTEAAQWFQAGYEAVVFGAGTLVGNSHGPNEHNVVDQIEKAVAFYESLIERVCL